jgi:hypothetical protein
MQDRVVRRLQSLRVTTTAVKFAPRLRQAQGMCLAESVGRIAQLSIRRR